VNRWAVLKVVVPFVLANGRPYASDTQYVGLCAKDWTGDPDDERHVPVGVRVSAFRCAEVLDCQLLVPYQAFAVDDHVIETTLPAFTVRAEQTVTQVDSKTIRRETLHLESSAGDVFEVAA